MLSYQHAYHAGNAADLHKHILLAELLSHLTEKPRGVSYVETHAGCGLYDLDAPEARKTEESASGVDRLPIDPATPFGRALTLARAAHGARAYPGSPLIARALLRPQDRLTLLELHPAEHAALVRNLEGAGVSIHRRDGREGVLALAPFRPRRGLVLIDPSYEVKSEYVETVDLVRRLAAKWPEAIVAIWYPLLAAGRHDDLLAGLRALSPLVSEVEFRPRPARGMFGSGLAVVNAPFNTERRLGNALLAAAEILAPRARSRSPRPSGAV